MKLGVVKQEQKAFASLIKELKKETVDAQRKRLTEANMLQSKLSHEKRTFRHRHIAYCLLRGRTMEQIECKVRQNNEPNMKIVEDYMRQFSSIEEVEKAS